MRRAVFVLLLSATAWAQPTGPALTDLMHARNIGMGGAFEALGYGAEAASGNPAAMTLFKRYQTEMSGAWDVPLGFGLGTVAVMDSTTPVAAGLTYHFVTYGADQRRWAHLTSFALAMPFGDAVHLGIAGRHHVITGATNTNSISMNAGLVVRPVSFLTLGLSAHNFISVYNQDVPRYFVASVAGAFMGMLTPAFDLRVDFNQATPRLTYSAGLEALLGESFPLRGGFTYDGLSNTRSFSLGLGYFVQGSGIDVGYRHDLDGPFGRMLSLTVKMQN